MTTTMTSLTLGAAVAETDTLITLSALTGINVYSPLYSPTDTNAATLLWVDQELMKVEAIVDTTNYIVQVQRGVEGYVTGHASGQRVFVGQPNVFTHRRRFGYEASPEYNPRINTATGEIFVNIGGYWSCIPPGSVPMIWGYGVPVNHTNGTGYTYADPGWIYVDRTNATSFINVGTATSPLWESIGLLLS